MVSLAQKAGFRTSTTTSSIWEQGPLSQLGANRCFKPIQDVVGGKATSLGRKASAKAGGKSNGGKAAAPQSATPEPHEPMDITPGAPLRTGQPGIKPSNTTVVAPVKRQQKRKFACFEEAGNSPTTGSSEESAAPALAPTKRCKDIGGKRSPAIKGSKRPWMPEEDAYLTKLVAQYGPKRWSFIASHFKERDGRVGKQCRERWQNHLDPEVSHQPWTLDEERRLMAAHADLGNRWVEIAKRIDGRTDSGCKNHFHKSAVQQRWKDVPVQLRWRAIGTPTGLVVGPETTTPPDKRDQHQHLPLQHQHLPLPLSRQSDSPSVAVASNEGSPLTASVIATATNSVAAARLAPSSLDVSVDDAEEAEMPDICPAAYALLQMMQSGTPE